MEIHTDKDNKIIYGVKKDGDFIFGTGIPKQIKTYVDKIDSSKDMIETEKLIIGGNEYYVSENQEWLRVITDNEGKIIAGIHTNGSTYISEFEGIDIDTIKQEIQSYIENVLQNLKDISDTFEVLHDYQQDMIEMTIDENNNVVSHRDDLGILHENAGIKTPKISVETFDTDELNLSDDALKKLTENVLSSVNFNTIGIPKYLFDENYINEKIFKFENIKSKSGLHSDTLIFITDNHVGRSKDPIITPPIIDYILRNSTINKVMSGGDMIGGWTDSYDDVIKMMSGNDLLVNSALKNGADFFGCRGNHDLVANLYDGHTVTFVTGVGPEGTYNYFVGRLAAINDKIVFNKDEQKFENVYFYYDNEVSKIRYICIDDMKTLDTGEVVYHQIQKIQTDWIHNIIVNTPTDYKLVFLTHIPFFGYSDNPDAYYRPLSEYVSAIVNKQTVTINGTSYDFSNAPDTICTFSGHTHEDETLYFRNCLWLTIGSDYEPSYNLRYLYNEQWPLEPNDITKTFLFDLVCLDYENNTIKTVRFGLGSDKILHIDTISININDTYELTSSLEGPLTWVIIDSLGQTFNSTNLKWTQKSTYANIDNGIVTALSSGYSTACAIDENGNFEFWGIKVN